MAEKDLMEKKVETREFIEAFSKLTEEQKTKVFYMIQGIELLSQSKKMMMTQGI